MAIKLQDNLFSQSPKLIDEKQGPFSSIQEAIDKVPQIYRQIGQTVFVIEQGKAVRYIWESGIEDQHLVLDKNPSTDTLDDVSKRGSGSTVPISAPKMTSPEVNLGKLIFVGSFVEDVSVNGDEILLGGADKTILNITEKTASTYTVGGLNSTTENKVIILQNLSEDDVTIKNNSTQVASEKRFDLPMGSDFNLRSKTGLTLIYNSGKFRVIGAFVKGGEGINLQTVTESGATTSIKPHFSGGVKSSGLSENKDIDIEGIERRKEFLIEGVGQTDNLSITSSFLKFGNSSPSSISGILPDVSGSSVNTCLYIFNSKTENNLKLLNESGDSLSGNRFHFFSGKDLTIPPQSGAILMRNSLDGSGAAGTGRWILFSYGISHSASQNLDGLLSKEDKLKLDSLNGDEMSQAAADQRYFRGTSTKGYIPVSDSSEQLIFKNSPIFVDSNGNLVFGGSDNSPSGVNFNLLGSLKTILFGSYVEEITPGATTNDLTALNSIVSFSQVTDLSGVLKRFDGQFLAIKNDSGGIVKILNESSLSSVGNRFKLPSGKDIILNPRHSCLFYYSSINSGWEVIGSSTYIDSDHVIGGDRVVSNQSEMLVLPVHELKVGTRVRYTEFDVFYEYELLNTDDPSLITNWKKIESGGIPFYLNIAERPTDGADGELAFIKDASSDLGKDIWAVYWFDDPNTEWKLLNREDNLVFKSELSGSLAVPSNWWNNIQGLTISDFQGKNHTELNEFLYFPSINPWVGSNRSGSLGGVSNQTVEVGTIFSPGVTASFSQGLIKNGDGSNGPALVGGATAYDFRIPSSASDQTYSVGVTNSQAHTFPNHVCSFGGNWWSCLINYSAGSGDYYTNKGVLSNVLDGSRGSGSIIAYSGTKTGRRYCWDSLSGIDGTPTDSAGVRATASKFFLSSSNTGSFTRTIPVGTEEFAFFVPAGKTINVIDLDNLNNNITGSFVTSSLNVNDANSVPVAYEKHKVVIGVGGFPSQTRFQVTIS